MTQDITSALQEQFLARSACMWHSIQASRFAELRQTAQRAMWRNLVWEQVSQRGYLHPAGRDGDRQQAESSLHLNCGRAFGYLTIW
jgi:hypothetical protein